MWELNNNGIYLFNQDNKDINKQQLNLNEPSLNPDKIYVMNPSDDKPATIQYNNSTNIITEKYKLSMKEFLLEEIQNMRYCERITTQQYKSEKGKIRKGQFDEVINFLMNRGRTKEYINSQLSQERIRCVLINSFSTNDLTNNYGMMEVKPT